MDVHCVGRKCFVRGKQLTVRSDSTQAAAPQVVTSAVLGPALHCQAPGLLCKDRIHHHSICLVYLILPLKTFIGMIHCNLCTSY